MFKRAVLVLIASAVLGGAMTAPPAVADDLDGTNQDLSVIDDPDPLTDSTPSLPSRDVDAVKQAQTNADGPPEDAMPDYERDGFGPNSIVATKLPYRNEVAPREDPGLYDSTGVRMFRFAGTTQVWNHPVGQAQWGLKNVSAYLNTGDGFYLDRALKQAQRNLDRKIVSRGAWWYPYDFDAARCADAPPMIAPWYSGMAQGQLLSLFVRLYEITDDAKWREAADHTFDSLLLPPDADVPWGSWVDENGYRWLEEYPHPTKTGERVMNGHIFAMYGVYDYWRITNDERAAAVFDGAATTVRHYLPTRIRLANWASKYSLGCQHPHMGYHQVHIGQTLKLYEITREGVFADLSSTLRSDYPAPGVTGTVQFKAGTHIGYKFDIDGDIIGTKTMELENSSNAPTVKRVRIKGRGIYYLISAGVMYGYLVPESFPDRVLKGTFVEQRYTPYRTLSFAPRVYTAYAYDKFGNVIASKVEEITETTSVPMVATAYVNGRLSYLPTSGPFKGWWMTATSGLSVL